METITMPKYYRIEYPRGTFKMVVGKNALDIVRRYDLATKANIGARLIELSPTGQPIKYPVTTTF